MIHEEFSQVYKLICLCNPMLKNKFVTVTWTACINPPQWKFRQLPCLGCKEPWVAPLFRSLCFKQVCLWLCNQRTVCSEPIPLYTTDDWYHHASWNLKHDALNLPWDTGRYSMRSAILCSLWGCPWGPCLFCHIMSMKRAWREGFSALVSEGEVLILRNEFVFIWRRLWILK